MEGRWKLPGPYFVKGIVSVFRFVVFICILGRRFCICMHFPALARTVVCICMHFYTFFVLCPRHVFAFVCTSYVFFMHVCALSPQWFWTITCTIWPRLQFRGQGSAQNFGAHLLFFHAPGWIFGPRVRFFGLGVDILARGQFWSVLGYRKK